MFALYAYCRELDDIVDEPPADGQEPKAALQAWRGEIDALYRGLPTQAPAAIALIEPVRRFGLPRGELEAILAGMEMDLAGEMVGPPHATLRTYCRRVAGAVGLVTVAILQAECPQARRFAVALGEAMQITNILRDLDEDAAIGRLYLPRELLSRAGVPPEPMPALAHRGLPQVCRALAQQAAARFRDASRALALCAHRRRLAPAIAMLAVYRRLLDQLEARGWHERHSRPRIGKPLAVWLAVRHGVLGIAPRGT